MSDETARFPEQMRPENLVPICIKALRHARGENRAMLIGVLRGIGDNNAPWALPDGFTSQAFDRLSYDTVELDAQLSRDLKALADYRRPIDGDLALAKRAIETGMVISYDAVRFLFGGGEGWRNGVIAGKWRLISMQDNAGFAVVPV